MAKKEKPTVIGNYKIPKQKHGRSELYASHVEPYLQQIQDWIVEGQTQTQIAKNLNVSRASFQTYMRDNPELKRAIILANTEFDERVVDSIKKRALGMVVTETKKKLVTPELTAADIEALANGATPSEIQEQRQILIETTHHTRTLPPDIQAARLYMQHSQMLGSLDEELKSAQIDKLRAEIVQIKADMANESEIATDWADKAREVAERRKQKKLAEQAAEKLTGMDWS